MNNIIIKNKYHRNPVKMLLYCLVCYSICRFCNALEAFIWFLHAFLDYYSCTLKCLLPSAGDLPNDVYVQNFVQAPPPSLSFWNCSKIRRECLKEREGKRKKAFAHTDWMMDFIWSLFAEPELGCVGLLCRFLWWKTQAMPDLTSTRNKKKACAGTGRGAAAG